MLSIMRRAFQGMATWHNARGVLTFGRTPDDAEAARVEFLLL